MMKRIIYEIIAIILFILGRILLQSDFVPFLQWWFAIFALGIIFLPFTSTVFHSFHDKGYLFSKTIGIAVTGYMMWLFTSLRMLRFTAWSCVFVIVLCIILNILFILILRKNNIPVKLYQKETMNHFMREELLFFALFLVFTYIRGFKPEAYGTEKFMDYGFMTSMMRSEFMPVQDLWFSGHAINYYYVGQYMATFLTKLSFVQVSSGYNLMLMMIGAFSFVLPYSLVYNLMLQYSSRENKRRFIPMLSGLIAGAGVCIAGNMHYPTFRWLEPAVRKFFGMEKGTYRYWFPDATRFIGYHPETSDKTIHEFPAYSFVLGDLHAHVINIIFVITVLGILFAWLLSRDKIKEHIPSIKKELLHPAIILIGFYIGLFHMTNYWDYPIYYVVSGAVILFSNMVVYNFKGKAIWLTALQGVIVVFTAKLISLPFTLNFDQIATNVRLVVAHTPINQMIILWGLPIFTLISFIWFLVSGFVSGFVQIEKKPKENKKKEFIGLFQFIKDLHSSDLFIMLLGLCAIGLVFIPEVIYVEDIYSGDFKRANTMFKLTYQAFIMFGICFGYIFMRLLTSRKALRKRKVAFIGLFLFSLTLLYPINAVNAWYGNVFKVDGYKGLNAAAFMEEKMYDDYLATNWLNENVSGMPVVLEANGDSYTDYQRVSVITGLPTLLGWRTHEWLWRSDTEIIDQRAADIQTIYTSEKEEEVRAVLKHYNISYIYVGKLEQDKFVTVNHELIKSMGTIVFQSPITKVKGYETYIIQVKE